MKKLAWTLLLLPFLAFQCKKHNGNSLRGKVVRISCASFVVQVLNNHHIGQDGWKDIFDNNKEYDDVITASNNCEIPANIQPGVIVSFRIEQPQVHNDCAICTLYDAPPTVAFEIKDIAILPD